MENLTKLMKKACLAYGETATENERWRKAIQSDDISEYCYVRASLACCKQRIYPMPPETKTSKSSVDISVRSTKIDADNPFETEADRLQHADHQEISPQINEVHFMRLIKTFNERRIILVEHYFNRFP